MTFSAIIRLQDDIVTRMLHTSFAKELDFDIKRLDVNAGGLLIGAIETTSQAVAQVLQYLFQHAEWLVKAKAAAQKEDPSELDGIVWEAYSGPSFQDSKLRWYPAKKGAGNDGSKAKEFYG